MGDSLGEDEDFASGTCLTLNDGGNERIPFFVFGLVLDDFCVLPDRDVTVERDKLNGGSGSWEVTFDEDWPEEEPDRFSLSVGAPWCGSETIEILWCEALNYSPAFLSNARVALVNNDKPKSFGTPD